MIQDKTLNIVELSLPELPEIYILSKQMEKEIIEKKIHEVEIHQPKNLNISPKQFIYSITGKMLSEIYSKGKWLFLKLEPNDYLLINLGMGADLLYFSSNNGLPEKYQFKLSFMDQSGFTIRFYWFGYIHFVANEELNQHKLTAKLGISPLDKTFTLEFLQKLLKNKRTRIKSLLLDQKNICGIGNVYIQDILFKANLHPNRKANHISKQEIFNLYNSIKDVLNSSIKKGGLAYEKNFYGHRVTSKQKTSLLDTKQVNLVLIVLRQ